MVITRVCTGVMSWFHAAAVHFVARVHKLSTHVARWKSVLQSWVSDIAHLSSSHVLCHHRFIICFARRVVVPVLGGVCFVTRKMLWWCWCNPVIPAATTLPEVWKTFSV